MKDGEERSRRKRIREWRRFVAHKYICNAATLACSDLDHLLEVSHNEFAHAVLASVPAQMIEQALVDLEHVIEIRKRPTLRCWIRGCIPRGNCTLYPYCTNHQGRCERCGFFVVPRARAA